MDKQNLEFTEQSDYSKGDTTLSEVVLRHIRKISDISSQEFVGGYVEKKPISINGGTIFSEIYHQDTREAYCNAVDFLIDIVYPKGDSIYRDLIDTADKKGEEKDIKAKLKAKKDLFRATNIMFERTNFFKKNDGGDEA